MYINMTPDKTNKTLHASQDDTNRQFKFKLVNNSQVLDTSDSIPPVIYDVEPNGVEQLLPVNSSSPSTTPIIADIQYPDELRENQEFVERITPTTIKGQAKIEMIKGNTIVWNQLAGTGKENRVVNNTTCVANGDGSFTLSTNNATTTAISLYRMLPLINIPRGHIFYLRLKDTETSGLVLRPYTSVNTGVTDGTTTEAVLTATGDINYIAFLFNVGTLINGTLTVKPICVDLTLMFGAGNEPSTPQEFTSLFPLSYYDYNVGSLLSFNGTGIKTTGKNLLEKAFIYNSNSLTYADGFRIPKGNYVFSFGEIVGATSWRFNVKMWDLSGNEITDDALSPDATLYYNNNFKGYLTRVNITDKSVALNIQKDCYIRICFAVGDTSSSMISTNAQLEIGSQATSYEPYTENTTDLPISTYFPTGMKSAGSIYDELTKSKATTRIGTVDLGSLTWYYSNGLFLARLSNGSYTGGAIGSDKGKCALYIAKAINPTSLADKEMTLGTTYAFANVGNIVIKDSSYTNATAFKTAMSGVYLYYELATPTEEDIESCSLVSENIEKPLEYDDGFLVCDSDGLTSKAGFIPCKVKKVKGDETLYSQLINLHVERKP